MQRDEALEHGRNIYLCRPQDPQALAEAIDLIGHSTELREHLRAGARSLAADWHRWDRVTQRMIGILESAIPRRGLTHDPAGPLNDKRGSSSGWSELDADVGGGDAPLVSVIVAAYNDRAKKIARAGTSGSKIGATGRAFLPILFKAQSNCGVLTAGRSTIVRCTSILSWMISERSESVNPLIAAFAPTGPVVLGVDDTIARRRGKRIRAKGIYRDPVRSSKDHFVKASGLRWLSLMLLAPIPWAKRVWALPFLTALAPSER